MEALRDDNPRKIMAMGLWKLGLERRTIWHTLRNRLLDNTGFTLRNYLAKKRLEHWLSTTSLTSTR